MTMNRMMGWLLCALAAGSATAAELVVDQKSGVYRTIGAAVKSAKAGDTIVVNDGVYRERLVIQEYYEGAPLTIRPAEGARAVISGFEPVTGWQEWKNGIYVAKVSGEVKDLYVGYIPQQCSRWPANGTRLPIKETDLKGQRFVVEPVADPCLDEMAKDVKNACCFYYFAYGNSFGCPRIAGYDPKTGVISFEPKNWSKWLKPENNRYSFMNHPALITRPGHWAYVSDDPAAPAKGGSVYFRPMDKADLEKTQRPAIERDVVFIGHWKNRVGNVVLDGLEVCGGVGDGIKIGGDDVVIKNCIVHHNIGGGISARGVKNVRICSNFVFQNLNNLGVASVENVLIEGNEVAHGVMDGIVVAGNTSGRKAGEKGAMPPTKNVTVRRNYMHHHICQGHPDNMQMYRDVSDIRIEENFDIWGGQSLMTEETSDVKFTGNLFMGCDAVMVICGHGNSDNWLIERNTFWGAGYGFFSFTGKGYTVKGNVLLGGGMQYGEAERGVKSSGNFFAPTFFGRTAKPWRKYDDLAKAQAEIGQEHGSMSGDPKLANMPLTCSIGVADGDSVTSLAMRKNTGRDDFALGDKIELNGDGKFRVVTAWDGRILSFEPALKDPPFRGVMVANWKQAKTTAIDCRPASDSELLVDGKPAFGSMISAADFMKGDLLGKGTRTLPVLPPDVLASIPDPNQVVVPCRGH